MTAADSAERAHQHFDPRDIQEKWQSRWAAMDLFQASDDPDAPGVSRGTGQADCDVAGPASELYLMLWNRGPAERLQVTGDPGILAAFGRALQITWS